MRLKTKVALYLLLLALIALGLCIISNLLWYFAAASIVFLIMSLSVMYWADKDDDSVLSVLFNGIFGIIISEI